MTEQAGVYRCGECGGPVEESARSCGFCRSPVATLRCAHCFQLNSPDSEHCSSCGEVLGLLPIQLPSGMHCPECAVPLDAFDGDPGKLHDCSRCGGQFIEYHLLYNLLERRRRFLDPRPLHRDNPLDHQVRYIPCPGCGQIMNRRNFGGTSGIIVDVCAQHGVWFHAGELPRVLRFVAQGGVAEARRARLGLPPPRTKEQQERAADLVASSMKRKQRDATEQGASTNSVSEIASGVLQRSLDLLELLGNFVIGRH